MNVALSAQNVSKSYTNGEHATPVIRDINLTIRMGELALLMGPSGSGKTTLVSILSGVLRASTGRVEMCGQTISEMSQGDVAKVRRAHLGFIFQSYNLFPGLTAQENVAAVLQLRKAPRDEARARAAEALQQVGLGHRLGHKPGKLSGGEKQRVAIARALVTRPAVVVGDEPTAALDTSSGQTVMRLLKDYVSNRSAVLLVTHDHRLEAYADRVIHIAEGTVARIESRA